MAQREGSVYLISLAVALVLFLGACGALFFVYNDKEILKATLSDKQTELAKQNDNLQNANRVITRLKQLIAGPGADAVGNTAAEHASFKDTHLKTAETAIKSARTDLGQAPPGEYVALIDPYDDIDELFKTYQRIRDQCESEHKLSAESFAAALKTKDDTVLELQGQITNLNRQVAEAEKRYEDSENLRQSEKEDFARQLADLRDECDDERIASNALIQRKENENQALLAKLEQLSRQMKAQEDFAELSADGQLVRVSPALQKGWVNLGRRDHLLPGLIFRVFQTLKGGRKVFKGQVEVTRVDDSHSEVRITEEADSLNNPIADGDFVASPFYDKGERPVFVLAGRELESKEVTLDYLRAKLSNYGVEVGDKVDLNTSYLVALKGYERTPEYAAARELRVPVLREEDVLEFIGY